METITRKRMLYKTKVDYQLDADGNPINDYAMNHVLGCSHGCKYPCYAFSNAKRFGRWNYNKDMPTDVKDVDAWYEDAYKVVRQFCKERHIECVIKGGTER